MAPRPPTDEQPYAIGPALAPRARAWLTRLGFALGLVLIAAAGLMIWRERAVVIDALGVMKSPSPVRLAVLLAAVLANLALSGLLFSLLLSRFAGTGERVRILEMQAMIAASALVNFLPLRPGAVGRIAYHRAVHNIPALVTARTMVEAAVLSVGVAAYLAGAAWASAAGGIDLRWLVIAPFPPLLLLQFVPATRLWALAILIRLIEVLIWAARYAAAFGLIGLEITTEAAVAFACVSVIASMVPLFSNGLGLREWAIGLLAPVLTDHQLELGLTAELVNRAAEILIVLIAGLAGVTYLARRSRGSAQVSDADGRPSD